MFKAAIFDMDGTMVDTEIIQSQAFEKILGEHGVKPKYNEHGIVHVPGITSDEIWEQLKREHGISTPTAELSARKRAAVMQVLEDGLQPMPGLFDLLEELDNHTIPMAIATSAQRERAELMLQKLGKSNHFGVVITADTVQKVKPAPDSYIAAAKALQVAPAECIVFEDTDVGVAAAKAANMKVVAIPNAYTRRMDFSGADLVISSLTEARIHKLAELFL